MELSRILSLVIAALYVIAFVCLLAGGPERGVPPEKHFESIFYGAGGMLIWLAMSLGCIWWGDELGEGLIGARYGLVSTPSPGWAVKLIGWIFLLAPALVVVYSRMRNR
ncbi:MAG: hypothetical protein ACYSWO_11280 [Planctomycetota bacterium]|jgi:hypothetical protein